LTTPKTYYRPGLEFKARQGSLCHQECCFPEQPELRNQDGTLQREATRALWAEFGIYGSESQRIDADGEPVNDMFDGTPLFTAEIIGGWFELDSQAEQKGWDERERELVAEHMLKKLREQDCQFTLVERGPVVHPAPWPTYDETHHNQIPVLAGQLGLASQALAYELQNKRRDGVVAKLREQVSAPVAVAVDDESLVAA
jgi:hypothetical protein